MPPNDDSSAADDFVFIDNLVPIAPLQDVLSNPPVESGYVTVDSNTDASIISVQQQSIIPVNQNQDTLTSLAPGEYQQTMVQIECFQPMPLSDFPKEIVEVVLMAPASTKHQAFNDQVNGPSSPAHPHEAFIKNAALLTRCFLHFSNLYSTFGRDFTLYTVGKACELNPQDPISAQQRVGCTLEVLANSRMEFNPIHGGMCFPKGEDANVADLVSMVDSYITFMVRAPQVEKMWYKYPVVESLRLDWQVVLKNKGFKFTEGKKKTAPAQNTGDISERTSLISEGVQAVGRLGDALTELGVRGGSGEMSETEKCLIEGAILSVKRWTAKINHPRRQ